MLILVLFKKGSEMKKVLSGLGAMFTLIGCVFVVVPGVWAVLDWIFLGAVTNDLYGRAVIVGLCAMAIGFASFGISRYIKDDL